MDADEPLGLALANREHQASTQRELLSQLLHSALGDKRVEVRRTEFSSSLHDELQAEERQMRGLLDKLEKLPVGETA